MTELWLIRHGQTDWNLEGRLIGQTDLPMNPAGFAQVEELAARLDGHRFSAVYSSDLLRARQTAEILSRRLSLPVHYDPRLREINQGDWEGEVFETITERYPQIIAALQTDPLHVRPPGGETLAELDGRLRAALDDLTASHPNESVLVVSHGLALAVLLAHARGLPLESARELVPENAAPIVVSWPPSADSNFKRVA